MWGISCSQSLNSKALSCTGKQRECIQEISCNHSLKSKVMLRTLGVGGEGGYLGSKL